MLVMEGALSKWTNVVKGWQYRWFVLDDNAGLFSYYTSKEKMMRGVRRGCVRLRGAIIGIDDEDDSTFTITVDGKTFHFQAQDSQERERWIRALEDTVLRHNQTRRGACRPKAIGANGTIKVEDFDRKLSETDSYLQMLIAQIAGLRAKVESPEISQESKEKYAIIIEKAVQMSESIKHAIVLLQIAKNAALPTDAGSVSVRSIAKSDIILIQSGETDSEEQQLSPVNRPSLMGTETENIELGIELGSECKESKSSTEKLSTKIPSPVATLCKKSPPMATLKLKSSGIPEISYSSSEEDDFFDAEDENDPPVVKAETNEVKLIPDLGPPIVIRGKSLERTELNSVDGAVDYDSLYATDNEEENVDMKSHGSVITHLLSQVRIGMDLTKIVLPTFILERRSLLEMYSDFFAHPDIFIAIADGKDPEDRMIRVLRWYLSSFHAGRKSTIAKKPYNPILGETFRCRWDAVVESNIGAEFPRPPQPWTDSENVTPDELTFVAEQVSHHPPVSAFYAEHLKKRISVNAYIYTKSSFLGMSVAVHNLGHGTVSLIDFDEEYIVTFPSGFGRSILTVPWVELGGKVSIQCPKTGYVSNIEFKCKQFFSSDVNKVTAEVFAPGSKKCVLKVDGEWNGKLMAKYASGFNDVFMDVSKIPIHPKKCRKVLQQDPFESRRLWREVTYGLKVGDIEAATTAKAALEKTQREEAQQRKENNLSWDTKLFHPIGDNWFFNEPLSQRTSS